MDIQGLSASCQVRFLRSEDVDAIYDLSCGNQIFYQYHPPFVTKESIMEDMDALPPGKGYEDKFYIGFFSDQRLIAVMDLILGYPEEQMAWIGLFMMDVCCQGKGIGSRIIQECLRYLKELGFEKVQLGVDKGNPQSSHFWQKNGFCPVTEKEIYIVYER